MSGTCKKRKGPERDGSKKISHSPTANEACEKAESLVGEVSAENKKGKVGVGLEARKETEGPVRSGNERQSVGRKTDGCASIVIDVPENATE